MSSGGEKDATHISEKILPMMFEVDPDRTFIVFLMFDGAYNVQKAGQIMV
jgi:hypothetical protein